MRNVAKPVLMAVIGRAHGTDGAVRVTSFTQDPMALGCYGLLYDSSGKAYRVVSLRREKTVLVVRFAGVESRSAAETLNGKELFIDRGQLPDDLEEDVFYHSDLLGFTACDAGGREIGSVKAIFNFGGGDLLEIAAKGRRSQFIPFSRAAVPHIDLAAGRIVVDPVAAGLETEGDDDEAGT